jgi:phosphotransferase system enzyme I (PtsI)
VLRFHSTRARRGIYRSTLPPAEVAREVRRWRAAVRLARRQLLAIKARAEKELGPEQAYIFDAHLLMLEDKKLLEDVEKHVAHEHVNVEWALKVVSDRLLDVYAKIKDGYLRERGSDVEDVVERLLVALSGEQKTPPGLSRDAILVAEELLPSVIAELDFAHVRAIVTDVGGWTSHTAIIARGLNIPAVVGLRDLYRLARTGDQIAVDAYKGEVVLHPSAGYTLLAGRENEAAPSIPEGKGEERAPTRTTDGVEIVLRANLELPAEYQGIERYGARGIGLYRTEFMLAPGDEVPSEEEQYQTYVQVARLSGEEETTLRLFDLGGDKTAATTGETERNPALGLRGVRFCLAHEKIFRPQVRAVLRAAAQRQQAGGTPLNVVVPMVSDITDMRRAKKIFAEERARLEAAGVAAGAIKLGAMIEVPSAVMVADKLAREVDFFSLGTNDLVQYFLAVDRDNDSVAHWFRTLHPGVLQSIKRTIDAAREAEIPVVVCGEMAAAPVYALTLIGLGATELSMAAGSIPRVRRMIGRIARSEAAEIAAACLACASADEAEELIRLRLGARWPDLFPPRSLPPPRNEK